METPVRHPIVVLLLVLVATLAGVGAGCSDGPPPEDTLANLGAAVGPAPQDETDFAALMDTYTTERYATETAEELVNYQLYLTARAADLALNQAEPPDAVETEVAVDGDTATVTFILNDRQGLFAVADVSRIEVHMADTGADEFPWRIDEITLER